MASTSTSTATATATATPISIVTSSDSSPLFSMQDALSSYSGHNTTDSPYGWGTLFSSGCLVDGIAYCTAACQDVNQVFADPHTFQNCMVVASLIVLGSIVTLDASSTVVAQDFPIHIDQPEFYSLASGANQIIQNCLTQYLNDSSGSYVSWTPWYFELEDSEVTLVSSFPNICDNLTSVPLNADVGGIGVREYIVYEKTDT